MSDLNSMEFDDADSWMLEEGIESLGLESLGLGALGDERFMRRALQQAELAVQQDEVPVGAIVVHANKIIATAFNQREQLADPTAHAEMIAITQAASHLNSWRLIDCTLFVTLEPCPMCAGAILQSRIPRVVYGALDPKAGAVHSVYDLISNPRLNHRLDWIGGVLEAEAAELLRGFFRARRQR